MRRAERSSRRKARCAGRYRARRRMWCWRRLGNCLKCYARRTLQRRRRVFVSFCVSIESQIGSDLRYTFRTMIFRRFLIIPLLGSLLTITPAKAQNLAADGANQTFSFLADQYFDQVYFKFSPTTGTSAGLHQYDTQLEDYSAAGMQREIAALHDFEKKVEAIDPTALDASVAGDREILLNNIRSQLLTLEVIRPWEKNPDNYSSGVTNSIFVIMERPYAPAEVRLHAVVEREKLIPQVLQEARKNLKDPPR